MNRDEACASGIASGVTVFRMLSRKHPRPERQVCGPSASLETGHLLPSVRSSAIGAEMEQGAWFVGRMSA